MINWYMLNPKHWYSSHYTFNKEWDCILNKLMDDFEPVTEKYFLSDRTPVVMDFDKTTVWIGNYPYAFGNPYIDNEPIKIRPSKKTIDRLYKLFCKMEKTREKEYLDKQLIELKNRL